MGSCRRLGGSAVDAGMRLEGREMRWERGVSEALSIIIPHSE